MKVIGPDWESTRALQGALTGVESEKVLKWGQGGLDGLEQLQKLNEANIPCPTYITQLVYAKALAKAGDVVWGRKRHHTQGKDIVPADYKLVEGRAAQEELRWITTRKGNRVQRPRIVPAVAGGEHWNPKWLQSDFWVQFIPSVAEFRQHIFNGKAIRVGRKIQVDVALGGPLLVRSRRRGWHIQYQGVDAPEGLRTLAKEAVASLGYLFGAVDILQGVDGQLYVLEVNSAPALTDAGTLAAYVDAVKRWA
jgi:hypothetical protein